MSAGTAVSKAKPADDKPQYTTIRLYVPDAENLAALAEMDGGLTLAEAFRKRYGKALKDERIDRTKKLLRELEGRD